jgi:type I restriction enzyme S subunit
MSRSISWPRTSVADICESIVDCVNKTAPVVEGPTPYKMIRTTNVRDGWVDLSSVRYVEESTFQKWTKRQKPKRGDVILTREAPLGEVGLLRSDDNIFLGQRLVSYRADPSKLDNRFFLYAMLGDDMQGQIRSMGSGATVEHMRVPDCEKLTLSLPPLPTQSRIASILSAYDDLIENNTRRIAILEEMARRIYEDWFVRFRFPGHEGVRMVESKLGLVPEGWSVVAASTAMDINPTTKVPKEGLKPFLAMNCLSDGSMLIDNPGERDGNSGSKFRNGDTLFARITPCLENGKTGFVQFLPSDEAVAFGSTEFIVLRSRTLTPEFVYLLARSDAFRDNAIKSMSGASGRQRVREACFDTFLLANPDRATLAKFDAVVRPMFRLIHSLALKNSNLRTTRDLLLPKLISGELDVASRPELQAVAA